MHSDFGVDQSGSSGIMMRRKSVEGLEQRSHKYRLQESLFGIRTALRMRVFLIV